MSKLPEPDVLARNSDTWTLEYSQAEPKERKKHERWGHPEIRQALNTETRGRCAYCEGFVADISHPHVEHIVPKSLHPELAHCWTNLTLACQKCNTNKGDYYVPVDGILNPYVERVVTHLKFHGGFVTSKLGKTSGEITVARLKLNRIDLVASRISRLENVRQLLERWFAAEGALKETLAAALVLDADEGEFSASVWSFLHGMGFSPPHAGGEAVTVKT